MHDDGLTAVGIRLECEEDPRVENDGLFACGSRPAQLDVRPLKSFKGASTWEGCPFNREQQRHVNVGEEHWRMYREEAWTQLELKLKPFMKTFSYEALPYILAGTLCSTIDGYTAATHRGFFPYQWWMLCFYDVPMVLFTFGVWYWRPPGLNPLDSISLILMWFSRAATIAFKYAFYGRRDLEGSPTGIGSELYRKNRRLLGNLLSNFVFNLNGMQPVGLLEQLFASALLQDVDLSKLDFQLASAEHAETIWVEVRAFIEKAELAASGSAVGMEGSRSVASRMPVCPGHSAGAPPRTTTAKNEENLDRSSTESLEHKWPRYVNHMFSHEKHATKLGMLDMLLGESGDTILATAKEGKLSAAVVAIHCIMSSHYMEGWLPQVLFLSGFFFTLVLGLSGIVVDSISPEAPGFWSTPLGIVLWIVQFVVTNLVFFTLFYYLAGPLKFFWNQRTVDAYLFGMLAGDLAVKAIFPPVCLCRCPRIDSCSSRNVAAWGGLQRIVRGSHFAQNFQKRFNFYRVITFSVAILDTKLHNEANFDSSTPGSKVASTFRLLVLASFIALELVLGVLVNNFAGRHVALLAKLRTANAATAVQTQRQSYAEELLASEHLLDIIILEIEKDTSANPVTVAFLPAEVARVSLLLSVVSFVVYDDLKWLRAKLEPSGV